MTEVLLFFQNQVLGMQWLNRQLGQLLSALGLNTDSKIGANVQFFLYDAIKISILLCFLIFIISYIQSYFPPERSRKILGRFRGVGANIMAALLGDCDAFLLLFVQSVVYWLFQCGSSAGGNFFVPDFIPDGGFGKPAASDGGLWLEDCLCVCDRGTCGCGDWRNND